MTRGPYPATRLRRSRRIAWTRAITCENRLTAADLIWPLFVVSGNGRREPIASMPGVSRLSVDLLVAECGRAVAAGIPAVAIFPATDPALKTEDAREALNPKNLVCQAVRAVKQKFGDQLGIVCDVALDPYSSHGQDGLVRDGYVVNDENRLGALPTGGGASRSGV